MSTNSNRIMRPRGPKGVLTSQNFAFVGCVSGCSHQEDVGTILTDVAMLIGGVIVNGQP